MSTINGLSSNAAVSWTQGTTAAAPATDDPNAGGGRVRHHGGHGRPEGRSGPGGAMASELMSALQSLGVQLPQTGAAAQATRADADASQDQAKGEAGSGSSSAGSAGAVRQDLHQFMHQLFDAVRSSEGSGTTAGGDPRSGFATGLNDLITSVSNGSAPTGLQSAFDQLMSDAGVASSGTSTTAPTLQSLLTQLQGQMGYAASTVSAGTGTVGNLVNSVA